MTTMSTKTGMRGFTVIWFGQLVSMTGSAMTRFALLIWLWQQTGEATPVVLMTVFSSVPGTLANLIAGPLIDRWNRKVTVMLADTAAGCATLLLLILMTAGHLQIWQIYLAGALAGIAGTFQGLAFSTLTTSLVPKQHYTRANGMMSLAEYVAMIGAPLLAGILISLAGIVGVLVIDLITFGIGVITLGSIPVPSPSITTESDDDTPRQFWQEVAFGFRYIFERPGLRGLLLIIFAFAGLEALGYPLVVPMLLARSGNNEVLVGIVQAVMGLGGIVGGVILSLWGGSTRKIHGILIGILLTTLAGDALMGLGQTPFVWIIAGFLLECFIPLTISSNAALW
ncbi:MAG TPA: MFS transporter, partial [Phototrophicaceae bacterium]|nr:MFS transporter [Phototrophicaceae bacterium]